MNQQFVPFFDESAMTPARWRLVAGICRYLAGDYHISLLNEHYVIGADQHVPGGFYDRLKANTFEFAFFDILTDWTDWKERGLEAQEPESVLRDNLAKLIRRVGGYAPIGETATTSNTILTGEIKIVATNPERNT